MSAIVNNTKRYVNQGAPIAGSYSVTVNLDNLDENIGKELYRDSTRSISIGSFVKHGEYYLICFRSYGSYSLKGAELASGNRHIFDGTAFSTETTARMKAELNGVTYESSYAGGGGINWKDGDEFCFYLFPQQEAGQTQPDSGLAVLTVEGLYNNRWTKR